MTWQSHLVQSSFWQWESMLYPLPLRTFFNNDTSLWEVSSSKWWGAIQYYFYYWCSLKNKIELISSIKKDLNWGLFTYFLCEGRPQTYDLTLWFKIINNKKTILYQHRYQHEKSLIFGISIRTWLRCRALLLVILLDRLLCIKWYSHHRDRTSLDKSIFSIYIG